METEARKPAEDGSQNQAILDELWLPGFRLEAWSAADGGGDSAFTKF
jgi:hypothetical protein